MSSRLVSGQVSATSALRASMLAGDGRGSSGVKLIQPPRLLVMRTSGWQALVELGQCRVHLLSQAVDERAGVERQVERLIMAAALRVEVGRQVLVGVAVAVRACHPHLLAAQLVAQGFEGANFVGDAVD